MTARMARRLLALGVLVLGVAGCGDDGEPESTGPTTAEVQAALDLAVEAGAPGIAVRINGPDGDEFLTAGVASLAPRREITGDDHLRIAGVTKSFTAAVTMELVEEGELSLDETVEEAAPGLLPAGHRITIRDLLAHYGYSDRDNVTLGLIVEQVTGRSYEDELNDRVLDPLGLEQTGLATEIGPIPEPHFDGYQFDPEAPGPPENVTDLPIDPNVAWASGVLISTPDDIATFFQALMAGSLVGREQVDEMMETIPGAGNPPGPGRNDAGLGIFGWQVSCGEVWGHTGSFPGFHTLGAASPDGESSLAFVVNATGEPDELNHAILEAQELAICRTLGESQD